MAEKDRDWYWEQVQQQNQAAAAAERTRWRPDWHKWGRRLMLTATLAAVLAGGAWYALQQAEINLQVQRHWHELQVSLGWRQPIADHATPGQHSDNARSLDECIKPGNLIDDEVRACLKGYRDKSW